MTGLLRCFCLAAQTAMSFCNGCLRLNVRRLWTLPILDRRGTDVIMDVRRVRTRSVIVPETFTVGLNDLQTGKYSKCHGQTLGWHFITRRVSRGIKCPIWYSETILWPLDTWKEASFEQYTVYSCVINNFCTANNFSDHSIWTGDEIPSVDVPAGLHARGTVLYAVKLKHRRHMAYVVQLVMMA